MHPQLTHRLAVSKETCNEMPSMTQTDRNLCPRLPGIPPTGRKLEIPFTAVVNIRGDRLYHEHIAWDQATVLTQLGLLPPSLPFNIPIRSEQPPASGMRLEFQVPAAGVRAAQKLRNKDFCESNKMFGYSLLEVPES